MDGRQAHACGYFYIRAIHRVAGQLEEYETNMSDGGVVEKLLGQSKRRLQEYDWLMRISKKVVGQVPHTLVTFRSS